ncbi:flagellar basal body P-ring formation chaperone FlgA [Shewanella algae]|uniref:flagellar basal body P-ring formation chaperone FlgA n=1 Tax=Shewanella algae TaxID=38313 RepID=UPI00118206DB|nr:flagellar basal body P-ring formation chaperone FlgA [Shewanella algae]TVL09183.1 flagellar biosynthesis protein FlgA [Shewanella algae]
MKVNFAYILATILMPIPAVAAENSFVPSISAVESLAKEAVAKKVLAAENAQITITPQRLDSRLTPPRCNSPLTAELASDREISRNNTVRIGCNSPELSYPWQIYVSVRVDISYPVVVATQTLAPGTVLGPENLALRYIDETSLRGAQFDDIATVTGTRLKRRIAKDYPVFAANLCFVCKGDRVSIYARNEKFQIKTVGEALHDGNLGEQIQVKNTRSDKVLEATVTNVGEVEVRM